MYETLAALQHECELHAFVDRSLPGEGRQQVLERLAAHPVMKAWAAAFTRQNALFADLRLALTIDAPPASLRQLELALHRGAAVAPSPCEASGAKVPRHTRTAAPLRIVEKVDSARDRNRVVQLC